MTQSLLLHILQSVDITLAKSLLGKLIFSDTLDYPEVSPKVADASETANTSRVDVTQVSQESYPTNVHTLKESHDDSYVSLHASLLI